jgi:hypothetical protein
MLKIYRFDFYRISDGVQLYGYDAYELDGVWWDAGPLGAFSRNPENPPELRNADPWRVIKSDISHEYNSRTVVAARAAEYPQLHDFADAFVKAWQGDPEPMNAYVAACAAVKAKHPKPVPGSIPPPTSGGPSGSKAISSRTAARTKSSKAIKQSSSRTRAKTAVRKSSR